MTRGQPEGIRERVAAEVVGDCVKQRIEMLRANIAIHRNNLGNVPADDAMHCDRMNEYAEQILATEAAWQTLLDENARLRDVFDAARDYIAKSPCDPDITPEQCAAYQRFLDAQTRLPDGAQ